MSRRCFVVSRQAGCGQYSAAGRNSQEGNGRPEMAPGAYRDASDIRRTYDVRSAVGPVTYR